MKKNVSGQWLMFMLGLGASTKVYVGGIIALSELVAFFIAPFVLFKHYQEYKRSEIQTVLWISLAMVIGSFVSCLYNGVYWLWFVKSAMQYYSIFAMIVVFYFVLRKELTGIGWFYVGLFISTIISIYALNPQLLTDERSTELIGQVDIEEQMEGVLFWYPKIGQILRLPIQGWYFNMPILYSIVAPIAAAMTAVLVSVSGRGFAAVSLLSVALIVYCRKSRIRMRLLGRHFALFIMVGIMVAIGIKNLYAYTARTGLLGEKAQNKYYAQTHGDSSFLRIMIGGRTEFFIAIRAMIDNPIIGIGPRAEDTKGYVRDFLLKYGDEEDFAGYVRRRMAMPNVVEMIPQHSIFTQFWGHAGICGLIFCLYFIYLVYLYFRRYAHTIPQWYGYFVLSIPPSLFSMFFNPYTDRVTFPLLITCLLIARAVGEGKLELPYEMEMEARKYE